ncbi:YfdQ family protein [Pseudomonas nitroreducens]|uniref:YfdQ family protein n=1 Tax=Pseudomonas nitroreducens TaxID=46680 RepID=UPI002657D5DB|nr:DUF2303 family protein [Pseudomonas nitroreducens]MCP1646964.1 uncharacterized protein YfdQ (DUF2303 family) [Pseudomonas nitroreducens]MCP1685540.1 uncharacterized protein YfdQ (DUF2303 family) [Pseudomonas nitroreducens]
MQEFLNQLVALSQSLGKPIDHPSLAAPVALVPSSVELTDLEHLLPAPSRVRENLNVLDAMTFIDYVKRFAKPSTAVFCNGPTGLTFTAVIDYHQPDQPAWGSHVARYKCPTTVEWGNWKAFDRKKLDQASFAEFIEDNVRDIVQPNDQPLAPSAADMLEISRTLEAKKNISFRQGTRLDNGQIQLTYNEEIDGRAGATGQLNIPEQFYIGVRPFLGGEAFLIAARFRYRIADQRLVMWFELVRPDKVLEEAYGAVRKQIAEGIGEVPLYEASA